PNARQNAGHANEHSHQTREHRFHEQRWPGMNFKHSDPEPAATGQKSAARPTAGATAIQQVDQARLESIYSQQAVHYDQFAALEREVADRLLERVEFQRREPARIIDLGCGTGYCAAELKRRYRKSEVVAVDFAWPMCRLAASRSSFLRPLRVVCANISSLPFAHRSADLLVANLSLQWSSSLPELFNGLRRVLRPGGLLLFSMPVTDSLLELRQAGSAAGLDTGLAGFPDMHDVGDALQASGFREPVMAAELITLTYPSLEALLRELDAVGAATYFKHFEIL